MARQWEHRLWGKVGGKGKKGECGGGGGVIVRLPASPLKNAPSSRVAILQTELGEVTVTKARVKKGILRVNYVLGPAA